MTQECTLIFRGHSDHIRCLALSRDGWNVVSGSDDCTVRVWSAVTKEQQHVLRGHTSGVRAVAFTLNDSRIVSAGGDGTIRVWDAETGGCGAVLTGRTEGINALAIVPDATRVLSAGVDGKIYVWDMVGQWHCESSPHVESEQAQRAGIRARIRAFILKLRAQRADPAITLGAASAPIVKPTIPHLSEVILREHYMSAYAVSPGGDCVATAHNDGTVGVWDANTGMLVHMLRGHSDYVNDVIFSADGLWVVSGSDDYTVRVWSSISGAPLAPLSSPESRCWVWCLAVPNDGKYVASGGESGHTRVWSTEEWSTLRLFSGHTSRLTVTTIAFSPNSTHVLFGSDDGGVHLWNIRQEGSVPLTIGTLASPVTSVSFSGGGWRMAATTKAGTTRVWNMDHDIVELVWEFPTANFFVDSGGWLFTPTFSEPPSRRQLWIPLNRRQFASRLDFGALFHSGTVAMLSDSGIVTRLTLTHSMIDLKEK